MQPATKTDSHQKARDALERLLYLLAQTKPTGRASVNLSVNQGGITDVSIAMEDKCK